MCEKVRNNLGTKKSLDIKSDYINNEVSEIIQNENIINWSALAQKIYNELKEEIELLEKNQVWK